MKLEGKVTVITGAGYGYGMSRGFPEAFAREGSHLSLNYYGCDDMKMKLWAQDMEKLGVRVILAPGDISQEETAERLIQRTWEEFGHIDVLVNNAGITGPKSIVDMTIEEWDRMIAVNLRSFFLTCKYVVPIMMKQKRGRIINIASQIAQKGGTDHCHYAAAKAGVIGLTKSLAWDLGKFGINVNCIAPGPINTQMMESVSDEWRKDKMKDLAIPRFGEIEEVVPSAIFLASSPDGDLYTGQTLGPNCGDVML